VTASLHNGTSVVTDSVKQEFIQNTDWYGGNHFYRYTHTNDGTANSDYNVRFEMNLEKNGSTSNPAINLGYATISSFINKSQVSITPEKALFYTNDSNYFEWTRDSLTFKTEDFEVDNIKVNQNAEFLGNTTISGSMTVLGQLTVSGSLASHPIISNVPNNTNNSDGYVIRDLTFDAFGHVVGVSSYDLDQRYYTEGQSNDRFFNKTAGDTVEGNSTFNGDVTVTGSLTVLGDTFSASVQTVEIEDNLFVINKGETGNGITAGYAGIEVDRGTADPFWFVSDENRGGKFAVGTSGSTQLVATREDSPTDNGITTWDSSTNKLVTDSDLLYKPTANIHTAYNLTGGVANYYTAVNSDI